MCLLRGEWRQAALLGSCAVTGRETKEASPDLLMVFSVEEGGVGRSCQQPPWPSLEPGPLHAAAHTCLSPTFHSTGQGLTSTQPWGHGTAQGTRLTSGTGWTVPLQDACLLIHLLDFPQGYDSLGH